VLQKVVESQVHYSFLNPKQQFNKSAVADPA